jgi:ADYC domain
MRLFVMAAAVLVAGCAVDGVDDPLPSPETPTVVERRQVQGRRMQGRRMQGRNLQGVDLENLTLVGFRYADATLDGAALANLRVVKGELLAERAGVTVRGTSLAGAHIFADATDGAQLVAVEYRIASVQPELAEHDPTNSGNTFLYRIEQFATDTWIDACDPDEANRSAAIPVAMTWDAAANRAPSPQHFTFGCTSAAIGKCYRWGYRPWLTGYGGANFSDLHQTCTRTARADYCGDGRSFTENGTMINVWDRLPAPGPIQSQGLPPLGFIFEAGWNPDGAVCLSRSRWLVNNVLNLEVANLCPDRLIPPTVLGGLVIGGAVCDTVGAVLQQDPDALIFNQSSLLNLNLNLLGL